MEYIVDGIKIIVEGDKQITNDRVFKRKIGANFVNGTYLGGYLSSFNESFENEVIGIQSGILDHINVKIGNIKNAYEILKTKINNVNINDIFELSYVILETIDKYFNGKDNIGNRMNYYYSDDYEESKNNKISNLEHTGAAMCTERAAVAQNLLKFLGINSFFKTSGIILNDNKEIHSYNLIEFNDKYYIFDSSITNIINNQINPLIAEIDKETFNQLSAPFSRIGISTTISHYNPYTDSNVVITYDSGREKSVEVNPLDKTCQKKI